jgi:hypothetical protein
MENKIYTQIPLVMNEIGSIGKNRKNTQQGYSFRGIDDIYNAVNSALSKHKIFCVPNVTDMKREERETKAGGTLIYTVLTVEYTFFAEDGSSVKCVTKGEAMDSGDKSCNKAMSAAQKYAFFQVFCIPTEEQKDTENETHEVKPKQTGEFEEFVEEIKTVVNGEQLLLVWKAVNQAKKEKKLTQEQVDTLCQMKDIKKEEFKNG